MPSDLKKKKAAAKKEAARQRGQKKATVKAGDSEETSPVEENGGTSQHAATNGVNAKPSTDETQNGGARAAEYEGSGDEGESQSLASQLEALDLTSDSVSQYRTVTGVLASHPEARDAHVMNLSITFHRHVILQDTRLELNCGRRYGLIGLNGCGKSTLLAAIANDELHLPPHFDVYLLQRELPPSEKTALAAVVDVEAERARLERETEELAVATDQESHERLLENYERLDALDADKAEARAAAILHGLGFTADMQYKKVKHFSGGWRMRIALARALFVRPSILLLDEPTNHLDLNACVWLEEELKQYSRILVIISHSQDFLNGVCTNILHMHQRQLKVYRGNYDSYIQTRCEQDENQMKLYKRQQDEISHMKDYIARFGHGSKKLARQAQSKEKTLKKMVDAGLTERVVTDKTLSFYFPDCGELPPPVIMIQHVSFRYADDKPFIYRDLDFGIDLDTKVALVGPNGAGKSTLLKLIAGELHPTDGLIRRHSHVRIGRYHQHLHEMLDVRETALDWMMKKFPEIRERDEMRKRLGRYGLSGAQQVCPIRALSDGQRCRIIFAWLAQTAPHLLLLDEPTNHLDIETIDSLAEAINDFEGGLLLVSHDFRLISQVTDEIWVCEHQKVSRWEDGDIFSYKASLVRKVAKDNV